MDCMSHDENVLRIINEISHGNNKTREGAVTELILLEASEKHKFVNDVINGIENIHVLEILSEKLHIRLANSGITIDKESGANNTHSLKISVIFSLINLVENRIQKIQEQGALVPVSKFVLKKLGKNNNAKDLVNKRKWHH